MPQFGSASEAQLATVNPVLVGVCREAIKHLDFTVVEGHRDQEAQHKDFLQGKSRLDWPNGNHNKLPSDAVDLAPYPVDWKDGELPHARFALLAGVMKTCADNLGVKIRWGVDWNRNWDPRDETFLDWGHFELDREAK